MYCCSVAMIRQGVTDDGKVVWICPVCGREIYIWGANTANDSTGTYVVQKTTA
jgi:predicted RNA-binding Zn-ribbon protein involved in translation (DUF1610 family)